MPFKAHLYSDPHLAFPHVAGENIPVSSCQRDSGQQPAGMTHSKKAGDCVDGLNSGLPIE
jgi:hypothetical protein